MDSHALQRVEPVAAVVLVAAAVVLLLVVGATAQHRSTAPRSSD